MNTDQIATLAHGYHELYRRLMEGSLPIEATLAGLQKLIGGDFGSRVVDLDADPFIPENWAVEEHKKGGMIDFDPAKITLYLLEGRRGDRLREELKSQPVFNANLLDWLLRKQNQHFIPEEWKDKAVCFWGTVYCRLDGSLYVRCLDWDGNRWFWSAYWLDSDWDSGNPVAVSAS